MDHAIAELQKKDEKLEKWIGDLQVEYQDLDEIRTEQSKLKAAINDVSAKQAEHDKLLEEQDYTIQQLVKHAKKTKRWMREMDFTD